MRWLVVLLCAIFAPALVWPAIAEVTPQAGNGDPHIQSVSYDGEQVVGLHVAMGFALTVQFAADERIETVTIGDSAAWGVAVNHRADHLVIRPNGAAPPTNMTVTTDQRIYAFSLYGAAPGEGVQPYLVSFTYPVAAVAAHAAGPAGHYRLHGARALWPSAITDDGTFTTLRWSGQANLPAVYQADDGAPALVNGVVRDGAYVVEGVHERLLFVAGKAHASATRDKDGAP